MMRLWVDFNSVEGDGIIRSPLNYAHHFNWNELKRGAVAELFDGEGQEARGEVVSVNRRAKVVRLRLDLSHRKSLPSLHFLLSGELPARPSSSINDATITPREGYLSRNNAR